MASSHLSLLARAAAACLLALPVLAPAATASPYSAAVLASHPTHYWRFGEPSAAASAADLGSTPFRAPHDAGSMSFGASGALAGDPDTAARLSGSPPFPSIYRLPMMGPSGRPLIERHAFAWEAWIKPGVTDGTSRRILSDEEEHGGVLLAARGDQVVFSRYLMPGTWKLWSKTPLPGGPATPKTVTLAQKSWATVTATLPAGRYAHVVGSFKLDTSSYPARGEIRLYVDGRLAASRSCNLVPVLPYGAATLLAVGTNKSAFLRYDGLLDELAVYDGRDLPAADVLAHYRAGAGA